MSTSPKFSKQLRKEINQEDKDEQARLDQAVKDINLTTKEQQKAHKAVMKADSNVSRMEKKESAATAAVQKATHEHDVAATHLHEAQRDAELKRREDMRLQRELDERKSKLDAAMEQQRNHKRGRDSRLQDLEATSRGPEAVGSGMTTTTASGPTGVTGNVPGQYGTGTQGPTSGGGYAGQHTTEAAAAGAGLAGGAGVAARGTHPRDTAGMALGTVPGQGQIDSRGTGPHRIGDEVQGPIGGHRTDVGVDGINRTGDTGLSTGPTGAQTYGRSGGDTYAGDRGIDGDHTQAGAGNGPYTGEQISRDNKPIDSNIGYAGDRSIRGPHTGYGHEGIDSSIAPGTALGSDTRTGNQGRGDKGPIYGGEHHGAMPGATSGAGKYGGGGGGENLGIRGDSMMGGSGTGTDAGIRSGGPREVGGAPEFVGQRNIGMGSGVPEPGYGAGQVSGQPPIHRGTGIGGRQGIGKDPEFNRDRMVMGGSGGQIGPGRLPGDSGIRGVMKGSGQEFGQDNMPGGYSTSAGPSNRGTGVGGMSAT